MKIVAYTSGFIGAVLFLFNILRFVFAWFEARFHLNFGIDLLLHNSYVIYGALIGFAIAMITMTITEDYLDESDRI